MENHEPAAKPTLEVSSSRQMLAWLAEQRLSIALTTYQIGKLFFIGLKPNGELSVFERSFNRCMGLCTTDNGLYMSSLYQIWRFENLLEAGQQQDGFDRLYLPQWVTPRAIWMYTIWWRCISKSQFRSQSAHVFCMALSLMRQEFFQDCPFHDGRPTHKHQQKQSSSRGTNSAAPSLA